MAESSRKPAVVAWLAKAQGDLEAAKACAAAERVPGWIVGFHLQQAVEKVIKARLLERDVEPPREHDLRKLSALLGSVGGAVPITAELAAALTKFAVRDRYPFLATIDTDRSETVALVAEVAEFVERSMSE